MSFDQLGAMRLRRHNSEPFSPLKVVVAADESCAHGEGGCSHPEVVLIKGPSATLLRGFDTSVHIASGCPDWLTRYRGEASELSPRVRCGVSFRRSHPV